MSACYLRLRDLLLLLPLDFATFPHPGVMTLLVLSCRLLHNMHVTLLLFVIVGTHIYTCLSTRVYACIACSLTRKYAATQFFTTSKRATSLIPARLYAYLHTLRQILFWIDLTHLSM